MHNQFERNIKIFQCDGGGEFQENTLLPYLSTHGIIWQVSCPSTQQQNGVVERKHRHIRELGMKMLFHSGLSKRLWVDAFSTATFLINRLPSTTLNMVSPYNLLFRKVPDYSSLRAFGCRYYAYLKDYSKNNFSKKTLPCVFIGYNTFPKGYWCLHPQTGWTYLSRHFVFNEVCFMFSPSNINDTSPSSTYQPLNISTYHE